MLDISQNAKKWAGVFSATILLLISFISIAVRVFSVFCIKKDNPFREYNPRIRPLVQLQDDKVSGVSGYLRNVELVRPRILVPFGESSGRDCLPRSDDYCCVYLLGV